ncbi:MAG: peptidylprolyl isomerase [Flavobacteriales bacterium]|nr:peptidylprolyl isomerase [Flavobacteriales bacterium]
MLLRKVLLLLALGLIACSSPQGGPAAIDPAHDNTPMDVLFAQDHRDVATLCAFLLDTNATVRRDAAIALASVQDTAAGACLTKALDDPDALVRRDALFALSFIADSILLQRIITTADAEPDTAISRVMHEAVFRAELRTRPRDAVFLISYLESTDRDIRTRAAQTLARLPQEQLVPATDDILQAFEVEHDPNVRMFLVGALRHGTTPEVIQLLKRLGTNDPLPMIRVAAVRALSASQDAALAGYLFDRTNDSASIVRQAALEQLERLPPPLDGEAAWRAGQQHDRLAIKIALYGIALRDGDEGTRNAARLLMRSMAEQDLGPYRNADLITAMAWDPDEDRSGELRAILHAPRTPPEKQAAFSALLRIAGNAEGSTTNITPASAMRDALSTHDAGLIAAGCEALAGMDSTQVRAALEPGLVEQARSALHPIRDLEAVQLLDAAEARLTGRPSPTHTAPPFNHPIDRGRLAHLRQGQRYLFATTKGDIVLAIEPDAAPGTCVAFDSLVTAGYYDGKTFHRVIPDFVAQGGCPRGDGYGSMDWTLRTEIGLRGFTTGAVGIASAGRDTESCQFFIMLAPAPHLDGRYTRFAHVVSGMDVAERLEVGDVMERVERTE